MPKFRKKPVVIEAIQWFIQGDHDEVMPIPFDKRNFIPVHDGATGYIDTLEGGHFVTSGDWIIKGVHGEYYACKPDIFEKTYEALCDHGQGVDEYCIPCGRVHGG
jgi:hypothetical protein